MAIKIKYLIFLLAALLFLAGCKLDKPDLSDPNNYLGGNPPPTDGGGTTDPVSGSYQPVTKGTYWKYESTAGGVTNTSTTTVTGQTTVINGKTYYEATSTSSLAPDPQTGYFSIANNIYTQREEAEGNILDIEELDASKPVGGTWTAPLTESGQVNGVPGRVEGKIIEKDISKTVSGKPFTHVIHTQLQIEYDYGSGFQSVETTDMYFAQGIGVIETDTQLGGTSIPNLLVDYSIK